MTFEVQAVVFPRSKFTKAEAQAWASLHGFDHGDVDVFDDWIHVHHRPESAFHAKTLHPMPFGQSHDRSDGASGVYGLVGHRIRAVTPSSGQLSYLNGERERSQYEESSALLRYMAILGGSRVGKGLPSHNADIVEWYRRWFLVTHPGPTANELAVAEAIAVGLGQATREHAVEYARKLGAR